MPTFFDEHTLTAEQRARWDEAVSEYNRIQEENVDRNLASMSPEEQEAELQAIRALNPGFKQSLKEYRLSFNRACGGGAGDPKSALFARLLNGKPALPYPPPTAGSYPWYEVIEAPGPFNVWVSAVQTTDALLGKAPYAIDRNRIAINRCPWEIVEANEAGARLLALQEQLEASAEPEKEGSFYNRYRWTQELVADVLAAYEAKPEFTVRFGKWSCYQLTLGRNQTIRQKRFLELATKKISEESADSLSALGSVFDTWKMLLNSEVVADVVEDDATEEPIENLSCVASGTDYTGLDALLCDDDTPSGENGEPDLQDSTVTVEYDDWVLHKMFLSAPFSEDEVQHLNEWQTQTGGSMPGHPFTCANRGDGHHGDEGGDTGVLIATPSGWVCPHCDYRQDWAHAFMAAPADPAMSGLLGKQLGSALESMFAENLEHRLAAYRVLAELKREGAATMVQCLTRRQQQLERSAAAALQPEQESGL